MKKFLLLLLLISCSAVPSVKFDNGTEFSVEIARTPEEKQKGLMFRESLSDDSGMLFVFENDAPRTFWMKNTLITLDMIFIDESMKIVEIKADVPPCEEDPCPTYTSKPAKYVLEINGGVAEQNKIVVNSSAVLSE